MTIFNPDEITGSRRTVLKWAGAALVTSAALSAGLSSAFAARNASMEGAVDLGSGDIGVLNYAYALEQLEAAFYTQVTSEPFDGMNSYEEQILGDIREHEVAHREFLRSALGKKRIPNLSVNFSKIDFGSRESVLKTASTFEDLGVSAYNGAGQLLQNPKFLLAAGRIVSIEARHAATIRNLLNPFSSDFAGDDVVDRNGLDVSRLPSEVLPKAAPFVATPVTARHLS